MTEALREHSKTYAGALKINYDDDFKKKKQEKGNVILSQLHVFFNSLLFLCAFTFKSVTRAGKSVI